MPDPCVLLAACSLMPQHLPDPSTKDSTKGRRPKAAPRFVEAAGGRSHLCKQPEAAPLCGWVWQVSEHQEASSKQAPGIKQQAYNNQALRNEALDSGKKLNILLSFELTISYERIWGVINYYLVHTELNQISISSYQIGQINSYHMGSIINLNRMRSMK